MKKLLAVLAVFCLSVGMAPPASAETNFSFSVSSYGRNHGHGPRHHHRYDHRRHWHRPPHRTVFYMPPPVYVAPPRAVVYETTVVRPVTTIVGSSLVVDQASPSYYDTSGRLCREYQSTGWVGGTQSAIYGTACLQPDGSWRVVD